MVARYLSVVCFLLATLIIPDTAVAQQSPIPPQFCYDGRCYRTLAEAESDLRASTGMFGPLWRPDGVTQTGEGTNGVVFDYRYWIDDQPPEVTGPVEYRVGGGEPYPTEESGIAALLQRLRSGNPQCEIDRVGLVGTHGEPFVHVLASGRSGEVLNFSRVGNDPQPNKYVEIQTWCAAWSPPSPPTIGKFWVPKQYEFTCREGFLAKEGSNPAYVAGASNIGWPNICRPNTIPRTITGRNIKQTNSCEVGRNPCYPATGDKARVEPDFPFAGQQFVRHYHSLNQLPAGPELGVGWSHNYADFVVRSSSLGTRVDERGYLQTYSSGRGRQASGEVLRAGSNNTSELTQSDGSKRIYGADGKLLSVETGDPATSVILTYDAASRIDRIIDGVGRALQFNYVNGRLTSISLPDGSQATYTYDGNGNLTQVVRPDGSSRTYLYGEAGHAPASIPNLMTGIVEDGVRYATFSYDTNGMVTGSQLHAGGQLVDSTTITYNSNGSATSVNPLGDVRQHNIGVSGGQFSAITKTIDALGTRSYTFNTSGRLTARVDARGNQTITAYADSTSGAVSQVITRTEESIGRITRTTRDANNRVVEDRVTQKVGGVEQLASLNRTVPDAQGRPLYTCQYDATQPTDYVCGSLALAPSNVRQTQRTYCTEADVAANPGQCPLVGLHRSTRDPVGNLTQFEYYAANDPGCDAGTSCTHRKGDLRAQINAIGQRTEILEYDASGNAIRIQAIDGTETERLYDSMGRMVTETLKGDVPANDRISVFEYNSTGKMTKSTGPDGVWTRMHYDTADRLTSVEDALGNRIVYTLDGAGNRVKEEIRDAAGTLRKVMSRSFDTASRNTRITGADGHAMSFTYDGNGNVLESEDGNGTIGVQIYDGIDRLIADVQDKGGISAEMSYEYDPNGQVSSITDPKGLRTTFGYNGFGDLLSQQSPDTGTDQFSVDNAGRRKSRTDARGVTAAYEYDVIGRLVRIVYPDASQNVAYVYDLASSTCGANERFAAGRLSAVTSGSSSTSFCYDQFGQKTKKVQAVDGLSSTVGYVYNAAGHLAQMSYPDGSLVDYGRDSLGRVSFVGLTRPGGAQQVVISQVSYAPFGPITGWTYGDGRTLSRPVDQDYRPTAVNDSMAGGMSIGFGYDATGALSELSSGDDDSTVLARYTYDALGRLTHTRDGATGIAIETYAYDASGNRTALTTSAGQVPYTYEPNSHRLTAVGSEQRSYDAAGNTIGIDGIEYIYNNANRMGEVKQGGATVERYVYNPKGERVHRAPVGGSAEVTVYDEAGNWLGDYRTDGTAVQQAIWLGGYPVALVSPYSVGVPELAYVEPDHLGTPRVVLDPLRNVAIWEWSSKSEVFGNQPPNIDPDGDGVAFELALRFPGQQSTAAAALFYNHHRDYDPKTGRYVQSDPIGLSAGPSTYAYSDSMPTQAYDPDGLRAVRGAPKLPNERLDGTIYCNGGVVSPYINWGRVYPWEKQCIGDCLVIHELSHVADANASNKGVCRYGGWLPLIHPIGLVRFDNERERLGSEFRAYAAELRCLAAKFSDAFCIGDNCEKVVRNRINDIINGILPKVRDGTYGN